MTTICIGNRFKMAAESYLNFYEKSICDYILDTITLSPMLKCSGYYLMHQVNINKEVSAVIFMARCSGGARGFAFGFWTPNPIYYAIR